MAERSTEPNKPTESITSLNALLCRLFWCFAGPAILGFLTLKLVLDPDGWISAYDLGFLLVLVATVGTRLLSFARGDRTNVLGEITTSDQLRRYTVTVSIGGVLVWIVANVLGNYVLH